MRNILIIFFIVTLLSCSGTTNSLKTRDQSIEQALLAKEAIIRKFGTLNNRNVQRYGDELLSRLRQALPHTSHKDFELLILDTPKPIAASSGGGFIFVSKGLIRSLNSEAELAFAIAHEMAHEINGDCEALQSGTLEQDDIEEIEMRADKIGAGIMAMAAYDPRAALSSLARSYRALGYRLLSEDNSEFYPSPGQRINQLQTEILNSGWSPPGIIDRREFRKVRDELISLQ